MFDNDIIDDIILATGGDIDKIDEVVGGSNDTKTNTK